MKRFLTLFVIISIITISFTSCQTESFSEQDLIGRWQNVNNPGHYMVFTNETNDRFTDNSYKYGYEWTESERYESDIKKFGNGTFEWKLESSNLLFLELFEMFADGEEELTSFPKSYTVTILNDESFSYNNGNRTYTFKKIQ